MTGSEKIFGYPDIAFELLDTKVLGGRVIVRLLPRRSRSESNDLKQNGSLPPLPAENLRGSDFRRKRARRRGR